MFKALKILEKSKFKTIDGGEYTLLTTGILAASPQDQSTKVGFISGQGPATGPLVDQRCSWTQAVVKGQTLTITLPGGYFPDEPPAPVLSIPTITRLRSRACHLRMATVVFKVGTEGPLRRQCDAQMPHSAKADDGSWESGYVVEGSEWSRIVDMPGEYRYRYHCYPHPWKKGVIRVK